MIYFFFIKYFIIISTIYLPEYCNKYFGEDGKRLRSYIKPLDYFGGNVQTIHLQNLREEKFSELSLKFTFNVIRAKYKISLFFRAIQEWNVLPQDIRSLKNVDEFKEKFLDYINDQAFSCGTEPD